MLCIYTYRQQWSICNQAVCLRTKRYLVTVIMIPKPKCLSLSLLLSQQNYRVFFIVLPRKCLAAVQTSWLGSYLSRVRLRVDSFGTWWWKAMWSILRLARNFVLFFPMRENIRSSSALLCGKVRTSCASYTRLWNLLRIVSATITNSCWI